MSASRFRHEFCSLARNNLKVRKNTFHKDDIENLQYQTYKTFSGTMIISLKCVLTRSGFKGVGALL